MLYLQRRLHRFNLMSVTLHYGPGALAQVQIKALSWGPYMGGPFGLDGLKKDDARQISDLCRLVPPGDQAQRSLVVGPMDAVRSASSDALLKCIEEYDVPKVRPFLWAWDVGEVSPTIRSRVLEIWVPGGVQPPTELTELGKTLLNASLKGNLASIIKIVEDNKGQEREMLVEASRALTQVLRDPSQNGLDLWVSIRQGLSLNPISRAQCVLALWPVSLRSSSSQVQTTSLFGEQ